MLLEERDLMQYAKPDPSVSTAIGSQGEDVSALGGDDLVIGGGGHDVFDGGPGLATYIFTRQFPKASGVSYATPYNAANSRALADLLRRSKQYLARGLNIDRAADRRT
jgi:hypothetical protein